MSDASAAPTAAELLDGLAARAPSRPARPPIPTGFALLDDVLGGGLRPGQLSIVGGRPGVGTTVLTTQWARNAATAGRRAVVVSSQHTGPTLVARLLACELGEAAAWRHVADEPRLDRLRRRLRELADGHAPVHEVLTSDPLLAAAEERFRAYADQLVVARSSATTAGVAGVRALADEHGADLLVVDALHHLAARAGGDGDATIDELHELAAGHDLAVVGVAAAGTAGLDARRLRLRHLRAAAALADRADVVLVLNQKVAVVAKAHLAYDLTRAEAFRRVVVCSVEKNRNGPAGTDLELDTAFADHRFEQDARWVTERLWEEGTVEP